MKNTEFFLGVINGTADSWTSLQQEFVINAVFLCCCPSCPASAIQMGQAVWAAMKKYSFIFTHEIFCHVVCHVLFYTC